LEIGEMKKASDIALKLKKKELQLKMFAILLAYHASKWKKLSIDVKNKNKTCLKRQ